MSELSNLKKIWKNILGFQVVSWTSVRLDGPNKCNIAEFLKVKVSRSCDRAKILRLCVKIEISMRKLKKMNFNLF